MAGLFGMEKREVIRIKVKKCEGMMQPEYKKMSVDPELTSFDILIRLLAKAFTIKGSFTISYLARDDYGQDVYLSLLSDWDLDAAFLSASDPYLRLKVDLKPFEEGMEDWDVVAPGDITPQQPLSHGLERSSFLGSLTGAVTAQVGKTVSQVTKAIGLKHEEEQKYHLAKPPMTDPEFRYFMDAVGHMVRPDEFRLMVYQGGVESSLRSVVWRHLLNVYPEGLSGKERFEYQKRKCNEYMRLRNEWKDLFSRGRGTEEMRFVANMVKKDVLRTDRGHKFYAGADDNTNILSLFNILVTYALTHPDVSYCQGMSDLASPILVVQKDEANAYLCFCGLMRRVRKNFTLDGCGMEHMFDHLSLVLRHRDPDFYGYLRSQEAHDMFFTYRWLLLELKREFPLDDSLLMLEIMWSSLPPDPPSKELELADAEYSISKLVCSPQSPSLANLSQTYLRIKSLCRHAKLRSESADSNVNKDKESGTDGPRLSKSTTPGEEEKNIDPRDFVPVDMPISNDLREKLNSIDQSMNSSLPKETVPPIKEAFPATLKELEQLSLSSEDELFTKESKQKNIPKILPTENHSSQNHLSQNNSTCENHVRNDVSQLQFNSNHSTTEIKVEDVDSTENNTEGKTGTPPCSPKRPDTIGIKKVFEPQDKATKPDGNVIKNSVSSPQRVRHAVLLTENGVTEQTTMINSCEEATEHPSIDFIRVQEKLPKLPPPHIFGDGNPFLMFLCLTLLVKERDHIIRNNLDFNELAMHFDKMVRQHNVYKVLHQAQSLYAVYLRAQTMASDSSEDCSV